jgi:hypothetical protein
VSSEQRALPARSMSKTVAATIGNAPFRGQVLSCFPAACNLADTTNQVLSLVTPGVGNGPLNVVLEGRDPFSGIKGGDSIQADGRKIVVGNRLTVNLKGAKIWDPFLSWGEIAAEAMAALWDRVQEQATPDSLLAFWIPRLRPLRGVKMAFQEKARQAAEGLLLTLRRGEGQWIGVYASAMAGLGPGATPAGDDFLMGLMTGLCAWPQFLTPGGLSIDGAYMAIAQAAIMRTNVLSAAYLRAAQAGHMGVGWHRLAAALASGDRSAIQQAADGLLAFGATSGADAMAGFLGPYLLASSGET